MSFDKSQLSTISDYQALLGKRVSVVERLPTDLGLSFVGTVCSVSDDGRNMILSDVLELLACPPVGTRAQKHLEMTFPLDKFEVQFIVSS